MLSDLSDVGEARGFISRHRVFRRQPRSGFTLVEAAITMAIIGLGVLSMLELIATGTAANVDCAELTTAVNLAKHVRERTLQLTFDQVRALSAAPISPPSTAAGSGSHR